MRCLRGLVLLALLAPAGTVAAQDLACDLGDLELRQVGFSGNHKFSNVDLEGAIVTSPSSWMRRGLGIPLGTKRCLDTLEVRRDLLRLRVFYRLRGYYNTTVRDTLIPETKTSVNVRFLIAEGAPTIVESVVITGLDSVPFRDAISRPLTRFRGTTFSRVALQTAIDSAVVRLLNRGYPYIERPLTNFSVDSAARSATIDLAFFQRFRGVSGPLGAHPARVISLEVAATAGPDSGKLDPATVRKLLYVKPGKVFSQEDVFASQRELYQLELARHVDIDILSEPADSSDTSIALRVRYTEAKSHGLRAGGGWATLDCLRLQARYTDRDLFQGAERLDLNLRVSHLALCPKVVRDDPLSDTLNWYVSGTLRMPALFGPRNQPSITVFSERTSEYKAYLRSTPIGGVVAFSRDLAPRGVRPGLPLTLSTRVEYGQTLAAPAVFCQLFNLCSAADIAKLQENSLLVAVGANLTHDNSNGVLNASKGSLQRFEFRWGVSAQDTGKASRWTRLLAEAAVYHSAGSSVFAARLQVAGLFEPWTLFKPATQFVPPEERLYAGGPNSVRGFGQNLLGPLVYSVNNIDSSQVVGGDTIFTATPSSQVTQYSATGGNTQVVATLEWRIAMPRPADAIQIAMFADAGMVWNRGAPAGQIGTTNKVKITPGVGLRYLSVVGPIRVDFAYNRYPAEPGAAYFTGADQVLRCVSPGNDFNKGIPANGESCPTTFQPPPRTGFWQHLTFNFSIGQPF